MLATAPREAAAFRQPATREADITIGLLTGQNLSEIQLVPLTRLASTKACRACAPRPSRHPISITAAQSRLIVSGGPERRGSHANNSAKRSTELIADGSFRLQSSGRPALLVTGRVQITAEASHLSVRLTLPMERYIVAVLSGETAPDEPLESLKAMAIVARTYAIENRGRHQEQGFDLCDDTHCQVARFSAARPQVEQAVAKTARETLWYRGTRAQVVFHQQCGGSTADARDIWQGKDLPYLRAHRDIYCVKRSAALWDAAVPVAVIQNALAESGIHADLASSGLAIATRTQAGRARTLSAGGTELAANTFRLAVNHALGSSTIKSDWYEVEACGDTIVFHGRGSGHGVGLCQIGAAEMAREGFVAGDILAEYFPGTTIAGGTNASPGRPQPLTAALHTTHAHPQQQ